MWSWWVGALFLASIAVAHSVLVGRALGVSGRVNEAVRGNGDARWFLIALVGGGLLAALTSGAPLESHGLPSSMTRLFGDGAATWFALLGGGVLVGLGTTLAGGCTSGHGLVGCARLNPASLAATLAFFGTAVAVMFALGALR